MIAAKPRVGAVVDLLSSIFNPSPSPSIRKTKSSLHKKLPADVIIHGFFKEHRNFGSHDRPFITDTVFSIIRNKSKLSWWIDSSKKKSWQAHILSRNDSKQLTIAYLAIKQKWNRDKIQSCFNEELSEHELKLIDRLQDKPIESEAMPLIVQAECPRILEPLLQDVFRSKFLEEMRAFQQQAPLDLRVNTLKATRDQVKNLLREEGLSSVETPYSTFGLRVQQRSPVLESLDLFKEGLVEIQDEGSQIVAMCTGVTSGNYVLDYCAGAGGKTLAMASMMNNGGRITACDIDESRLMNAKKRLARAGVFNTNVSVLDQTGEIILSRKKGKSDVVLVDAPCTGSGTWRRAPDLKWRLQADDILEYASAQQTILSEASKYVKDGGRLVYTTCSLLKVENEAQISAFLDAPEGKNFEIVPLGELWSSRYPEIASPLPTSTKFWRLTPYSHNTDAFFISVLQKSTTK